MAIFGSNRIREIKKAQKEKLLFREISELFFKLILDQQELQDLTISKVILSDDKSHCFVYFYSSKGIEYFKEKLELLKLYKPSMRKAIAAKIESRYTPELTFKFDEQFAKGEKISQLLEKIKTEHRD